MPPPVEMRSGCVTPPQPPTGLVTIFLFSVANRVFVILVAAFSAKHVDRELDDARLGLVALVLIQRGARLVYEFGTGVIGR